MLPRKSLQRAQVGLIALSLCGTFIAFQAPVQAFRGYAPPVQNTQISLSAVAPQTVKSGKQMVLFGEHTVSEFTLVGVTWQGRIDPTSRFEVRVREHGVWSDWQSLSWSNEHGADASSSEAKAAREGTDPLLTALATGVAVRVTNESGTLPTDVSLSLVNSNLTSQDHALLSSRAVTATVPSTVTSPQGAVVPRPKLITRAQWGANESWRNQDPGMGTKIIAGFLHHTASTNSYSADQGPAQMRNLFSYYTQSLHYKDLAYSFLVDKYGNVYEGRSGCPRVVTTACDGPARPAIGAHTAGMNLNTFAISAIGNYHEASPGTQALQKMDDAIAGLMAWKIAPYGLDPKAIANIPVGSDPHHLSRYREGDIAHVLTISGHRDVGQTVCPGQYLYPELPAIRDRISALLTPVVAVPKASPAVIAEGASTSIAITSVIASGAAWSIDVIRDVDSAVVGHAEGTTTSVGPISFGWTHLDTRLKLLPSGTYTVRVQQSVAPRAASLSPTPTPTASRSASPTPSTTPVAPVVKTGTTKVVIAAKPTLPSSPTVTYRSKTRAWLVWKAASSLIPVTYQYRVLDKQTNKWSGWKIAKAANSPLTVRKLVKFHGYKVQLKAVSAVGESVIRETSYLHKSAK